MVLAKNLFPSWESYLGKYTVATLVLEIGLK